MEITHLAFKFAKHQAPIDQKTDNLFNLLKARLTKIEKRAIYQTID